MPRQRMRRVPDRPALCHPFHRWRYEHSIHHASVGDLDRRGTGHLWTMTVQECFEASCWERFAYRLARNPFILFIIAPLSSSWFWKGSPPARTAGANASRSRSPTLPSP